MLNPEENTLQSKKPALPIGTGIAGDFRQWSISSVFEPEFLRTVRFCYVFGREGKEIFLVTYDDEVWARGTNIYRCLGLGTARRSPDLSKVTALSGKGVQSFASGTKHVLALTNQGKIYGWGGNQFSQVGIAESEEDVDPTLVYDEEDPAVEIACGAYHSACRTQKGDVYCWGHNSEGQIGISLPTEHTTPQRVEFPVADLRCTGISCARKSTVACFENGEVYAWGLNDYGQLGIGPEKKSGLPVKVELKNAFICKVSCGAMHTLALAIDGSLYVWGYNVAGRLGLNSEDKQCMPIRHNVISSYGRVIEMATVDYTSAVMTENSKVFMWGDSRWGTRAEPIETNYKSVQDVFALWAMVSVTPVPLLVTPMSFGKLRTKLLSNIAQQFNIPAFSDVKFRVENETIYAHKLMLARSEYFSKMFKDTGTEDTGDTIHVSDVSYPVLKAFVQYFYTDEVNLDVNEALRLLKLATFCSENALMLKCQRCIRNMISVENFASVYLEARRCGAVDLEHSCVRFAVDHQDAISQTNAFAALPGRIKEEFSTDVAEQRASGG